MSDAGCSGEGGIMATGIPIRFYRPDTDDYRLPDGRIVRADIVREHRSRMLEIRERIDADRAYDPYNHVGEKA